MKRYVPLLVFVVATGVVLGAAGQIPLDQLHHVLHIALPTLAFAIFAVHVAQDVIRHGWPAFSWRLNP